MRIVLGRDFDGGSWPGALGAGDAAIGVSWVGPLGFVGLLETALGLTGLYPDDTERAAELAANVGSTEGFWSRSAERDLLGSAARLLSWRDELWESGFHGARTGQARLDALAAVTCRVSPGLPDRLEAIRAALEARDPGLESVELADSAGAFSPAWRRVFAALESRGVRLSTLEPDPSVASGDLRASSADGFNPAGDRSLQLMRPANSADAAEHVAAWIATQDPGSSTVVIGSCLQLDRSLCRFGVPTLGAAVPPSDNPLLAVLPLVVGLGWGPADPQQALELLALRRSPVPARVGWKLADALARWPAVDSDEWRRKLENALDRIADAEQRSVAAGRIRSIFTPSTKRDQKYPVAAIVDRAGLVDNWLSELVTASRSDAISVLAARAQVARLISLAEGLGGDGVRAPQLARLLALASASAGDSPATVAQAGIDTVSRPGAVVGSADRIVWWDFTASSARQHRPMLLSEAERRALTAAGAELPDPGADARLAAARWRRPFEHARETLLLVCPKVAPNGDEGFAHPVWDEVVARIPAEARPGVAALVLEAPVSKKRPPSAACPGRALPVVERVVQVNAGRIRLREEESPSSLGKLVGCNFAWVATYPAGLSGGRAARVAGADSGLLRGNLAHLLIGRLLVDESFREHDGEEARRAVEELFDREAPRLAAVLYLPGADRSRDSLRSLIGRASERLLGEIRRRGGAVVTEETFSTRAFGTTVGGRVDLLLENPKLVVDLKLGGTKKHRELLESGAAYQLAVYSNVVGAPNRKSNPDVAYFILVDQRWLTTSAHAVTGVAPERGPSPAETWKALAVAVGEEVVGLESGFVTARGCGEEDSSEAKCGIGEGRLVLPSPCKYCEFDGLCGRAFKVNQ